MSLDPEVTTATIAPTLTTVFERDVRRWGLGTLQVQNLDPTQVFSGYLRRKVAGSLGFALVSLGDFLSIQPAGSVDADGNPTDSVTADLDLEGSAEIEFVGKMDGAGGDISWALRVSSVKP